MAYFARTEGFAHAAFAALCFEQVVEVRGDVDEEVDVG